MIVEIPSMEGVQKVKGDPEMQQKRIDAEVILESQVMMPVAD